VTIRPSNIASYTRNEDASLESSGSRLRGFVKTPILEAQDADLAPAAAVA
jgi:hypothetical protein